MPYRIVPVGDKLVLMIQPERQQRVAATGPVSIDAHDSNAGYYDPDAENVAANEGFTEIPFGGNSHE